MSEQEHTLFERCMVSNYPSTDLTREGDGYRDLDAHQHWTTWQAARQAPASGEVEPVVWIDPEDAKRTMIACPGERADVSPCREGRFSMPLYTHPPAKVPEGMALIPLRNGQPEVTTDMKIACIGEFSWQEEAPYYDEDGDLHDHVATHAVPWDICKDIYKKMAGAALLSTPTPATTPQPADNCSAWPCWNCKSKVSMDERGEADGDCPKCGAELDLDLWPNLPQEQ